MNICMVGTGYVGLVTGACLADFGMDVTCVDKDEAKIALLKKGVSPIYEPGLEELIHKNEKAGRLRFTTNLAEAIERSLVIFIAVGTPPKEDGSPDLSFIFQVAESIATHMNGYKVVVTKSTVPTGTGAQIEDILRTKNGRYKFSVVSNPEFLREGSAIEDFMHPDRVVIGSRDEEAIAIVKDVYSPLAIAGVPFVVSDVESAELIKYASNGFLALKISFINEVAAMCERMGADVKDVARGMGLDKRIAPHFLNPGPGY
ncbi:MAG: UDP-glucose dehydrogenase family protein, partial [Thermoanaerobaculia bacterium]